MASSNQTIRFDTGSTAMTASIAFESSQGIDETCRVAQPDSFDSVRASGEEAGRSAVGLASEPVLCPTTTAMIGVLCGIAFTVGLIASGWPPAVGLPEFVAMICAGLFSIAGGCVGLALERIAAPRN